MFSSTPRRPRIAYDDLGHGEPALLFLPGWAGDRNQVLPTAEIAARHRRSIILEWRGHGRSDSPVGDFGYDELVEDSLAVIAASRARSIVPVSVAHAGWVAIELRRRLASSIAKLILVGWHVGDQTPPFRDATAAMQDPARWRLLREGLFAMWLDGESNREVGRYVREVMESYGFEAVARSGREIAAAYSRYGSPLKALATLKPPVPTLHLYGQPRGADTLQAQNDFAAKHRWFSVRQLESRSHFPTIAAPNEVATAIESFVGGTPDV